MNPWLGLLILFAVQAGWTQLTRELGHRGMSAEWSRKVFHAGSGTILLSLPLLFKSPEPVVVWGLIASAAIGLVYFAPAEMRQRLAGNVYEVGRTSYGDLYFVWGIVLLFFLAAPQYYTYAVPLTILSFADAAGALVGKRFGRHKYEAAEGRKSVEGSLAFFAVAFISVLLWMPALPHASLVQVLLIAVILGMLTMLLEAIAWKGLDNLLVPLGGYLLLTAFLGMTAIELAVHLIAAVVLVAFVLWWYPRTTLNHSALIAGALFGYVAWTVPPALFGHRLTDPLTWAWLLMPLIVFLSYNLLQAPQLMEEHHAPHSVDTVFSTVFPGGVWLLLALNLDRESLILPYATSFACVALNIALVHPAPRFRRSITLASAIATAVILLLLGIEAAVLAKDAEAYSLVFLLSAPAAAVVLSVTLRALAEHSLPPTLHEHLRWNIRAAGNLIASAVAALPFLLLKPPAL